ncbi:MAG: hypothetical protein ACK5TG_02290 [Planctomyces sp.]|nr:hypothetical protein [Planctomyces sp.]
MFVILWYSWWFPTVCRSGSLRTGRRSALSKAVLQRAASIRQDFDGRTANDRPAPVRSLDVDSNDGLATAGSVGQ